MNFPKDPFLLLSFINTMLRDKYPSLSALCEDTGEDEKQISETLKQIGYEYSEQQNRFL